MKSQLRCCLAAFLFVSSVSSGSFSQTPKTRTIVDMAGQTVTIPAIVNSVYATSPMGEIMMYTLAPNKIAGMTWTLDDEEKELLLDYYVKKPVLGGWFGKSTTGNPEVIIKAHPDIVLSMGFIDKSDVSASKRIQEKLGIPVVMLDGKLTAIDSAYRFLGRILGEQARADTLARFCRATIDTVRTIAARIPENRKIRVYYAEGLNGLETDPRGSMHTEVLDMAGGINVAEVPALRGYGRATVSFEQLLLCKPQLVLVCLDHGYAHGTENFANIMSNPSWQITEAISKHNVYEIPSVPFNCFDRPPSANRIFGLLWLENLLYPDYFNVDINETTKKFYALFYHINLTDAQLEKVLLNAVRTKEK